MQTSSGRILLSLFLLVAVAACGGSGGSSSTTGELSCPADGALCEPDDSLPRSRCGGSDGAGCPQGQVCVQLIDGCDPETGVDCPGECQPAPTTTDCTADTDCKAEPCVVCPGGQEICLSPHCIEGQCSTPVLDCPLPPPTDCGASGCPPGFECVDDSGDRCEGGPAVDCPAVCRPVPVGGCASDADCPQLRAPCAVCADGSQSCPQSYCKEGQCIVTSTTCPTSPRCGGISGEICPPGTVCIDMPGDACDPQTGADCGGICVPDVGPKRCGGFAGEVCAFGEKCVDDPNDDCDPNSGGADCGGICQPAPTECTSDAECAPLPLPCSFCPDGARVCPSVGCVSGRCEVAMPACPALMDCAVDPARCQPGYHCVALPERCDPATNLPCPSVCVADDQPRLCGNHPGEACPQGWHCVFGTEDGCSPGPLGLDCGGVCVQDDLEPCSGDEECPQILAACTTCPDGSLACPRSSCAGGRCVVEIDSCPIADKCGEDGEGCPPGFECRPDPTHCDAAGCVRVCVPREQPPQCSADADCGAIPGSCRMCPDGSTTCVAVACLNGVCQPRVEPCPPPSFCGGIAGFPCAPGFECVDDPGDSCDPASGGADCGGRCVPAPTPPACDAADDCLVPAGPCVLCADGSAACPRASCVNGECSVERPTCGSEVDHAP